MFTAGPGGEHPEKLACSGVIGTQWLAVAIASG